MVPIGVSSAEVRASSTKETSSAATPPAPCWNATSAGIWIMLTRTATTQPMTAPTRNDGTMTAHERTSLDTSTKTMASPRARAARKLPRRAPAGERNWAMPAIRMTMIASSMTYFCSVVTSTMVLAPGPRGRRREKSLGAGQVTGAEALS